MVLAPVNARIFEFAFSLKITITNPGREPVASLTMNGTKLPLLNPTIQEKQSDFRC